MPVLEAPQLVTNSRMLYFTWVPADPDAVRDPTDELRTAHT